MRIRIAGAGREVEVETHRLTASLERLSTVALTLWLATAGPEPEPGHRIGFGVSASADLALGDVPTHPMPLDTT